MKVECLRLIGRYFAPVVLAALFGLAQIAPVNAEEPGYSIVPYGPVEDIIKYRLGIEGERGIPDSYCGDPTIDGYIALNEKLLGIDVTDPSQLGSTIGKVVYIIGNGIEVKGCVVDVAAAHHVDGDLSNGERPADQIADVSDSIWKMTYPHTGFTVSFENPRGNDLDNMDQFSITKTAIDNISDSVYDDEESYDYDFHADLSEENIIIPRELPVTEEQTPEQSPVTVVTSGSVYGSQMNTEEKTEPVMPLFEEADSPNATIKCGPGDANEQREFKVVCKKIFEPGYFEVGSAGNKIP